MIYLNGHLITNKQFPNGELNLLEIEKALSARKGYKMNHFVFKYEDDKDLMALYFAKKHVDERTNDVSTLSITYMPYSRMDRAETNQTPFMLKFACEFINQMKFNEVYVHEAHSNVTRELLNNVRLVFDNVSFVKHVEQQEKFNDEKDYIVFPDKGAYERYNGKISSKNMLFGKKKRDFSTGKILTLEIEGDKENINENSTAIIVDDLSSFGGTFVGISALLKKLGFKRVVLLVCHAENSIFKGNLFEYVDKVYTTDTILTDHTKWENVKYKVDNQLQVFNLVEQLKEGYYK